MYSLQILVKVFLIFKRIFFFDPDKKCDCFITEAEMYFHGVVMNRRFIFSDQIHSLICPNKYLGNKCLEWQFFFS